jgi:hypothetical protein
MIYTVLNVKGEKWIKVFKQWRVHFYYQGVNYALTCNSSTHFNEYCAIFRHINQINLTYYEDVSKTYLCKIFVPHSFYGNVSNFVSNTIRFSVIFL